MALSKNRIKYIRSLEQKKHRKAEGVFLAEGPKLIEDLLETFPCILLVGTREWLSAHPHPEAEVGWRARPGQLRDNHSLSRLVWN